MEFELEDRSQQMGEEIALDMDGDYASPQRERRSYSHAARAASARKDHAIFIPEQETGAA